MLSDERFLLEEYANDEEYQCISESTEDYIHTVLTTLVHNYHDMCGINTVRQSLVNHYTRNMGYLRRNLDMAVKLIDHYSTWQRKYDSIPERSQRETRQTFIRCFGIILHGIFPDHFRKYYRMNSELKRYLLYLDEKKNV
jgi:hypothetical protein